MKLLVVDDDVELCAMLCQLFEESGYFVEFEPDGKRGLRRAEMERFDLLILDGEFEVLRKVREKSQVPILILSKKAEPADRVAGLRAGADDYLAKPFDPEELLARVHAILRRASMSFGEPAPASEAIEIGNLRLLPASRDVYFRERRLDLTAMEAEILECLMRSFGRAVSRDRLSLRLYNRLPTPFDRSIDTHVSRIRQKMGEGREMILTVRGTGYQLRLPAD